MATLEKNTKLYALFDRVFFYENANAINYVARDGGQKDLPSRGKDELVGRYTANSLVNSTGEVMHEVAWVNSWWESGSIIRRGTRLYADRISWVKDKEVTYSVPFVVENINPISPPQNPTGPTALPLAKQITGDIPGLTTNNDSNRTTLYIIGGAVVIVLIVLVILFRPNSKK